MRIHLLVATTLVTGCVTADQNSPDIDPLAMVGGTTGTVPVTSTSVPSPCPYPVMDVASGVDLSVSWANLDEAIDGTPLDLGEGVVSLSTGQLPLSAAEAEVACNTSFRGVDITHRFLYHDPDGPPETTIPADHLEDGGATFIELQHPDQATHIVRIAAILLKPTSTSSVTHVEMTTDAWIY